MFLIWVKTLHPSKEKNQQIDICMFHNNFILFFSTINLNDCFFITTCLGFSKDTRPIIQVSDTCDSCSIIAT